jgi:putative transposase
MVESLSGRSRQERLNAHWFMSLDDARHKVDAWRQHYNVMRPTRRCSGPRQQNSPDRQEKRQLSSGPTEPEISTESWYSYREPVIPT